MNHLKLVETRAHLYPLVQVGPLMGLMHVTRTGVIEVFHGSAWFSVLRKDELKILDAKWTIENYARWRAQVERSDDKFWTYGGTI